VLRRREDGYHEIRSLVQSIELADELMATRASGFRLECDRPELAGEANLVARAARKLAAEAGIPAEASLVLRKRIPVGAGLGGGSGNAAGTLKGLVRLWNLSIKEQQLYPLAADLGADVPFFLRGGCQVMEGIGERLTPVETRAPGCAVVVCPPFSLSTADIYRRYDCDRIISLDWTERAVAAVRRGDLESLAEAVGNQLGVVACAVAPALARACQTLKSAGALCAAVSGSGGAIFGLCPDMRSAQWTAQEFTARWRRPEWEVFPVAFTDCAIRIQSIDVERAS